MQLQLLKGRRKSGLDLTAADRAAGALLTLGALNWGVVGATNFDVVRALLGGTAVRRAVYGAVGASAAYALVRGRQLTR